MGAIMWAPFNCSHCGRRFQDQEGPMCRDCQRRLLAYDAWRSAHKSKGIDLTPGISTGV